VDLYLTTVFIATITPGPSVLLGLRNGIIYGKLKSVATALGITVAAILMGSISLLGLGAVLVTSGLIFRIIKYAGACYLIYLGIKLWLTTGNINMAELNGHDLKSVSSIKLFFQTVGFGNPKAILFFTALFPQFITQNSEQVIQYFIILFTLAIVVFACMMIYIFGGQKFAPYLKLDKFNKMLNKISGGIFVGFGIGLAVSE
jgi:homoserine/homoserine lactone efflux protein